MKKLLYILLFVPIVMFGQSITIDMFNQPINTNANMTIGVNSSTLDQFESGQIGAFYDLDGDGTLECVGLEIVTVGFFGIALWGDNLSTPEVDGLLCGDWPIFAILHDDNINIIGFGAFYDFFEIEFNSQSFGNCDNQSTSDYCEFEAPGYCTNSIVNITDVVLFPGIDIYQTEINYLNDQISYILDSASLAFANDEMADAQELMDTMMDSYYRYNSMYNYLMDSIAFILDSAGIELIHDELADVIATLQDSISSLNETSGNSNNQGYQEVFIPIHLPEGWSMFGYTCQDEINVEDAFAPVVDKVTIIKDDDGYIYLPEYDFNSIGEFVYSRGYLIKTSEEINDFSICPTIIESQTYQVGDLAEGGIVFYVDSTGQHGLVAALEDLTEGATDPYGLGFNGYEWGCYNQEVNGADGTSIVTGYHNTMDIVNAGCETEYGGVTAAQAALDTETNSYSDWFLPSKDELVEMYNTIGDGGLEGNIGGFETSDFPQYSIYWSSSEYDSNYTWFVYFNGGGTLSASKYNPGRVRVIRAF